MWRAAAIATVASIALALVLGATGSAFVGRGVAGAPLSISFKDANGTTTTTVTIAADGTYKADFGISSPGDATATIKGPTAGPSPPSPSPSRRRPSRASRRRRGPAPTGA